MTRPTPPRLLADANDDGHIGIEDVFTWADVLWAWVKWAYFLPGDTAVVVIVVELDVVAQRYGVSTAWYAGAFSGLVSAVVWGAIIGAAIWWFLRKNPPVTTGGDGID